MSLSQSQGQALTALLHTIRHDGFHTIAGWRVVRVDECAE